MPARTDLFDIARELAKRVGCLTVWRGEFLPCELDFLPNDYPAMAFREDPETIVSFTAGGHACKGTMLLDFWIWTGQQGVKAIARHPDAIRPLDQLHDRILDHLSDSYPLLHSQTISIAGDDSTWAPYWWYVESPHAGATLRLPFQLNRAPQAH